MQKITPCLWFDNHAEQAVDFYLSVFNDSRIISQMYYGEVGPGPDGSVLSIDFQLEGQDFIALNGGPYFEFNPAISLFVNCETQDEIDRLWAALLTGGGKTQQCGWVQDQFGVSWQIVPTVLGEMLRDSDKARSQRVMAVLLQMNKLDIAALKQAYG
ncbi:VOC family protein [Methylophaga sp. OBS4]|uniref:VOC family protein n=1 Tax=Methylophaga sp. OBS4 TaxID=2991935 RepID=UPI002255054C|nr:VOC family protein [Methylophaga sp. OBS4]MCX4188026.1 VOC family protein [Methylophaga sp. OBS4]